MKQSQLLLLLLFSFVGFSQAQDKSTYFYFENQEIEKKQFKKLDERKTYRKKVVTDTAIYIKAYQHKKIGRLDSVQHAQINLFLEKIIGKKFNPNKKNMIHLYNKNDDNIHRDGNFKQYWRWISRNGNQYNSYLIGTKASEIDKDEKNHIYKDSYDLLRNFFFKDSHFEINHLLIKPSGEVYIFYGMEDILAVLDWSVD